MRPPRPPSVQRTLTRGARRARDLERRTLGPWHRFGDPGEPGLLVGVPMAPTAQVPDPVPGVLFRYTLGAGPEVMCDLDGVVPGDIIGYFPAWFIELLPRDVAFSGHDNTGQYVACRIRKSDGAFLYGVA